MRDRAISGPAQIRRPASPLPTGNCRRSTFPRRPTQPCPPPTLRQAGSRRRLAEFASAKPQWTRRPLCADPISANRRLKHEGCRAGKPVFREYHSFHGFLLEQRRTEPVAAPTLTMCDEVPATPGRRVHLSPPHWARTNVRAFLYVRPAAYQAASPSFLRYIDRFGRAITRCIIGMKASSGMDS